MTVRVRCPSGRCGAEFDVSRERLGRAMECPSCGVRLTARPVAVDEQLKRQQERIAGGPGSSVERLRFAVLVDNVRSLWNVGSIFRTADACGVRKIVLTGISGCPPRAEITKTALGAETAVEWSYSADPVAALRGLVAEGYAPVALERTARSVPLDAARWPRRVCLVIGNEVVGITAPVLDASDRHVHIPMRGVKDSLNVAVAFGIAAHAVAAALAARAR